MQDRSVVQIDLSAASRSLLTGVPIIAGLAIALGIVGWVVSRTLPPYYESAGIVVVTNPDLVFRFDPRIETQVNPPPGEGLTEVALSDEIVAGLLDLAIDRGMRPSLSSQDLRRDLRVTARGTTLTLQVRCPVAEICAMLSDRWARMFADKLNEVYGRAGSDAEAFSSSAAGALSVWEDAQAALTAFQATNDETALELELQSQTVALGRMLDEDLRLRALISDARAVRTRIASTAQDGNARQEDQLLVPLLALRSLSSGASGEMPSQPSQIGPAGVNQVQAVWSPDSVLQISVELTPNQVGDAVQSQQYLDRLITSMEAQQRSLKDLRSDAQGHMLEVQAALSQTQQDRSRLEDEVQLSRETYQTLARKAVESRLAFDEERVAQIATQAVVPDEAAGPSATIFAFTGFLFGLASGSIGVALRSRRRETPED